MVLHLPLKHFISKAWGEKNTWKCALQPVCTYLTTSTGARWCITDSTKIFHCLILPYTNQKFLAEIFLCVGGNPPNLKYFSAYPPPSPSPLKGCVDCIANPFAFVILKQQWADPHATKVQSVCFPSSPRLYQIQALWPLMTLQNIPTLNFCADRVFHSKNLVCGLNIYLGSWCLIGS